MTETTGLSIDKRLELELKVINEFKDETGVVIRTEIANIKEKINQLNKRLEDVKNYTKASKAYLTRATRRILATYNSHLRRLEDLHIALFSGDDEE